MSQDKGKTDGPQRQAGLRLALDLGMKVFVSFDAPGNEEGRIAGELVGLSYFEYLIVRMPWIPGLRSRLVPGNPVTIRLANQEGDLFGFQAEILSSVTRPALLLFLAYPDQVETLSLRSSRRVSCSFPVHAYSRRGDANGLIVDISRQGCRMILDVRGRVDMRGTVVGDELLLRTTLSTDGLPLAATCCVRSVTRDVSRLNVGAAFVAEPEEAFAAFLQEYLDFSELLSG